MPPSHPHSCEPHRPLTLGCGCWPEAAEGRSRFTLSPNAWQLWVTAGRQSPWLNLPFMSPLHLTAPLKWIFHVAWSQTSSPTLRRGVQRELSSTGIFSHRPCDNDICQWQMGYAVCVCVCVLKWKQLSGTTYIVILVFVAVIIADHWLGLPSALPLLAFVLTARLLTQLDLNSHRLGWRHTREEEDEVTALWSCLIVLFQHSGSFHFSFVPE